MQLEFPHNCLTERTVEREESDFDEDQGSVPEYILSAISVRAISPVYVIVEILIVPCP